MLGNRCTLRTRHAAGVFAALACWALLCCLLCACTGIFGGGDSEPPDQPATPTFTDSSKREVEIPESIERVAVTNSAAQEFVITLAPDLLVGLSEKIGTRQQAFIGSELAKLPVLGQLYGDEAVFSKEALDAARPQVIVDIGEPADTIAADMDELQAQTGIPCVHIDVDSAKLGDTYAMLGWLLNRQDRATELAEYCNSTYQSASQALSDAKSAHELRIAYLLGSDGTNTMPESSMQASVVDAAGDNVMKLDPLGTPDSGTKTSAQQIALWNPDLMLFASQRAFNTLPTRKPWKSTAAIRSKCYYKVPRLPYNWLSSPIGPNQLLGMQWLALICDANGADADDADAGNAGTADENRIDLKACVAEHLEILYHHKLTNAEYKQMTKHALP